MQDENSPSSDKETSDESDLPQVESEDEPGDLVDISIDQPAAENVLPAPAIEFDLPCSKCGYNLRNVSRSGRCPECGRFVSMTLREVADWPARRWIILSAVGVGLLLIASVMATLAAWWGTTTGAMLFGLGPAGPKLWLALLIDEGGRTWLVTASIVLHVGAMLAITLPKDNRVRQDSAERLLLLILAAMALLVGVVNACGLFKWLHPGIVEYRVLPLMVLFEVICLMMEYLRLAKIAARVRRRKLPGLLRVVGGLQVVGLMLLLLWGLSAPTETVQWLTLALALFGPLIGTLACLWLVAILIWRWRVLGKVLISGG